MTAIPNQVVELQAQKLKNFEQKRMIPKQQPGTHEHESGIVQVPFETLGTTTATPTTYFHSKHAHHTHP